VELGLVAPLRTGGRERDWEVMFSGLKRSWRELKKGRPGHRFQERAERSKRKRSSHSGIKRFLKLVVALLLVVGGMILCVIPGPGLPLLIIGAALLAERSRTIARGLDWIEVKARRVIAWGKAWWRHATGTGKFAAVLIGAVAVVGGGYGAYSITFGR